MKKGFTIVELIAVLAIIAVATVLIGSQFFQMLGKKGKTDEFEKEVIAKSVSEAAYVYIDSRDNKKLLAGSDDKVIYDKCYSTKLLVRVGYISSKQGLLTECNSGDGSGTDCLDYYYFKVVKEAGEKKVKVYYNSANCSSNRIDY